MAADLETYFDQGGYSAHWNHQGDPYSSKGWIISDINDLVDDYDKVAVVMFNHGGGRSDYSYAPPNEFHYMMEDNTGTAIGPYNDITWNPDNGVYDMDIYPCTYGSGTVTFALINTCRSADTTGQGMLPPDWPPWPGRARGMTFAWTRRLVKDRNDPDFNVANHISDDGWNNPDTGDQVYIGFPWGSASLMQKLPHPSGTKEYHEWVDYFFDYALNHDVSVNYAVNKACLHVWGKVFVNSPLRDFTAYWWFSQDAGGPQEDDHCSMAIYGNGNIHLKLN